MYKRHLKGIKIDRPGVAETEEIVARLKAVRNRKLVIEHRAGASYDELAIKYNIYPDVVKALISKTADDM